MSELKPEKILEIKKLCREAEESCQEYFDYLEGLNERHEAKPARVDYEKMKRVYYDWITAKRERKTKLQFQDYMKERESEWLLTEPNEGEGNAGS